MFIFSSTDKVIGEHRPINVVRHPGIEPGTLRFQDNHEAHYATEATDYLDYVSAREHRDVLSHHFAEIDEWRSAAGLPRKDQNLWPVVLDVFFYHLQI